MIGDVSGETPRGPQPTIEPAPPCTAPPVQSGAEAPLKFVQYLDSEWLHWSVAEVDCAAVPGARGVRCLVFSREGCVRRVWDYPPDWRTYAPARLAALSWRR